MNELYTLCSQSYSQQIYIMLCLKLGNSLLETIKGLKGIFNENSMSKDKTLGIHWQLSIFWKQNTWRCWIHFGCNQIKSEIDSLRIRQLSNSLGRSKSARTWSIGNFIYSSHLVQFFLWTGNPASPRSVSTKLSFGTLQILAFLTNRINVEREEILYDGYD